MSERTIKVLAALVVALALAVAVAGCGCEACGPDEANARCADHGGVREWNSGWGTVVCRDGVAF